MKPLEFLRPATLAEALTTLGQAPAGTGILAGGTDLIVQWRTGSKELSRMVDIKALPELNVLEYSPATGLRLGAAVPCATLGALDEARQAYPGLVAAAELIGSTQIQSRASVGGNVCNGSPAADTICALIVLEAVMVAQGPDGQREIPARDFMTGPGATALQPGELLSEIRVPPLPSQGPSAEAYLRFIPRNEMDIAVAGAAVWIQLSPDKKSCTTARVAIGAVAPTPLLVEAAGAALTGATVNDGQLDDAAVQAASQAASAATQPITDVRGTAEFRTHLAGVLTRRVIALATQSALERA